MYIARTARYSTHSTHSTHSTACCPRSPLLFAFYVRSGHVRVTASLFRELLHEERLDRLLELVAQGVHNDQRVKQSEVERVPARHYDRR